MTLTLCHFRVCQHSFLRATPAQVCPQAGMQPGVYTEAFVEKQILLGFLLEKNPRHMMQFSLHQLKCVAREKDCMGGCGTSSRNVCPVMCLSNAGTGVRVRGGFYFWDLNLGSLSFVFFSSTRRYSLLYLLPSYSQKRSLRFIHRPRVLEEVTQGQIQERFPQRNGDSFL